MKIVSIHDARRFSLERVETRELAADGGLRVELLCFEAGQRQAPMAHAGAVLYQVLEGEAVVTQDGGRQRLGKDKLALLAAGSEHRLENAGGGLLVVLATRAEPAPVSDSGTSR